MRALPGGKTPAELASEYGRPPTKINTGTLELVKYAMGIDERGNRKSADPRQEIDHL